MRQSAGTVSRSTTFTPDFRVIGRTIAKAMEDANGLGANDIACVFPHGNGIRSSDRSEALALQKVWGALDTPVVSYKAQIGYLMASSALVDMALMSGFLGSGSLPAFKCEGEAMPAWASTCMPTNPRTACQATLASRSGLESKDLSVPQSSVPCVGGGARHDDTHRKAQ